MVNNKESLMEGEIGEEQEYKKLVKYIDDIDEKKWMGE